MTATRAARCCSTPRWPTAGRRCWRSARRSSAGSTGGRDVRPDAASTIIGALAGATRDIAGRPAQRPSRFADAGITLLRTSGGQAPEIWCRCDGGPHGFLSIAAHAHADALSVEVRYGGVDILADPGTYCYHGEPAWRSYFRSTIAHNTVELGGQNQSSDGGPFLWLRHANAREIDVRDVGDVAEWTAEHDGYLSLDPPARHRRSVRLDRAVAQHRHRRRDRAAATTSALPFTSAPTCRPSSTGPARSCAGPAQPRRERRGWSCRAGCGGACTEARPTRSSAGTPAASGAAFPPSRSSAAGAQRPVSPSARGWSFSTPERPQNLPLPGQPYHGARPMP